MLGYIQICQGHVLPPELLPFVVVGVLFTLVSLIWLCGAVLQDIVAVLRKG